MFNKLREKLKGWVQKVSEESKEEKPKKEKDSKKKEQKKEKNPKKEEEKVEEEKTKEEPKKGKNKKSIFNKLTSNKRLIAEKDFEKYSEDLEMLFLENNVALEVVDKIIENLRKKIVDKEVNKKEIENEIKNSLKEIIESVLLPPINIVERINQKEEKPFVMLFCGINGAGKTTTIAKIANLLKKEGISSIIAAGDTFRAASIEQLKKHSEKLNLKLIAHEYGSDPASVGFDAIKYAKKNKIDTVLIDTAGRMHTEKNLLKEMEKIKRVCNPDLTIFVGESITGNDSTEQIKSFDESIGIDSIILSKADIDEKGGTALSVGYTTKKPILFLGKGQNYEDLEPFDKKKFIEELGL
ncbi:signal recognition particle-docking protein FtsY [Candidatus Pacearchaeota archaeon ex4484_71]|nr:MAG: signal recognition particle-docking protein FtsY [Candidatus Pacearchaeota archaeon ex4484_71]